ncbi:hypothetical protein [Caballeronia sp. INSB1]|uniref:hypothetical protein n=1 Tax=Caballeronia sp. INSB1 TaxID=2921751 RepID=UPI002032A73B|nr:hypothetical protein [Caballeronia sp. INSB1]
MWTPLLVSLILVAVAIKKIHRASPRLQMNERMGNPVWNIADSWASNLTGAGAVLGTLFSFGIIPATDALFLKRESYGALGVFFVTLVVLAPVLYKMFGLGTSGDGNTNGGRVWTFLFVSTVITWGAFGQTATLFLIFQELIDASILPSLGARVVQLLLIIVGFGMCLYVPRSIYATAMSQVTRGEADVAGSKANAEYKSFKTWSML